MSSSSQGSTWTSQSGYVWSLIGSAVGFANILSFSAQVYKNGGGAFLIPYCMALLFLGIPFLMLEGLIGNKWKLPVVSAYSRVAGSVGRTFGWMAVLACLTIGAFYIVLTGYSVAYTYFSAINSIPDDSESFFLKSFLQVTPSLSQFGSLSLPIFIATIAVGLATWFVLVRNVRDGIEKICTVFMPLMALIMLAFALIVLCLPGGIQGLVFYLRPDFSKLLNLSLWRDAFGQLFFSLSLGLGIIIGYSRHTSPNTNVAKAMLYVALGDFTVSFISGAAIFGCLAHIAHVTGTPFDAILTSDSTFEIGFILFPKILKLFGPILAQIIGVTFFSCVFIAGVTGVFSIVESIAGNVEVEFRVSRQKAVTYTIAALLAVSVFFCMGNATHLIAALVPMVLGLNMLIGGLALLIVFWLGSPEIRNDAIWYNTGNRLNFYGRNLMFVVPILLIVILIGNLWNELQSFNDAAAVRWGWLAAASFIALTLATLSVERCTVSDERMVQTR